MEGKCGYCHKNPVSDKEEAKILGLCEHCAKTLAMSTTKFNIDHARMDIIGKLNRYGDEFPELKKEIFYYDKELKCFTTKGLHHGKEG